MAEDSKGYVQKLQTSSVYGNIKPREPGYYWVKWSDCEPSIERWDGGHWLAPGSEEWSRDNDGVQVLSERLTPPQQMQTVRVIAEDYSVQRDGGEIIDYGEKGVELGRRPAESVVAAPVEKIDALLKEAIKTFELEYLDTSFKIALKKLAKHEISIRIWWMPDAGATMQFQGADAAWVDDKDYLEPITHLEYYESPLRQG